MVDLMLIKQPQRSAKSATAGQYRPLYCTSILTHEEACEQLRALGFEHTDKMPTSGSGRIPARGKNQRNQSASVRWTDDSQALHWSDYVHGENGTVFADSRRTYSSAEIAQNLQVNKERTKRREAEQDKQHSRIAKLAQEMWANGFASGDHLYIENKQLVSLHNARIDAKTGELLIPMCVHGVGLVNVQRIYQNGEKRFLKGGRITGAYSVIGSIEGNTRVLICEGWATGATLHELYDLPIVVAFNAGNLMAVARVLRSQFPTFAITFCGDDDRQTPKNPGRTKAIEAAEAIGAAIALPELCKCCKCSDYNDLAQCGMRCDRG